MRNAFLIKVNPTDSFSVFIDEVELRGNKEKLQKRLQDINYVKELGIHESFWFEPCELVLKDSVDFPDFHY